MKREDQFILASLLGRGWMWEISCSHGPVSCLAGEWRRIWESRIVIWDYRGCWMPELGCLLMQACGQAGTFCWHFPQIISCVLPFPHSVTDYHLLLILCTEQPHVRSFQTFVLLSRCREFHNSAQIRSLLYREGRSKKLC